MALRAIAVLKDVCAEMEELCPDAWIFNYTNPVNIVAEAVTHHSPREDRLALRGADLLPERDRRVGGPRSRPSRGDDGRPEPRLLGRRARLRRTRPAAPDRRRPGSGAATTRRSSPTCTRQLRLAARWGRSPPTTSSTTTSPTRSWPSSGPSRRPGPRTSSAGRATTGATTRSRRRPTTHSSTRPAHAAASTSSSSRST